MKDEMGNLEKLKLEYSKFEKKYPLPNFNKLNEFFDVEEIEVESDFLLRKIRRLISERVTGYARFVDIILNPSNAPMFFFKLIKKLDNKDKESLSEVYEILGKLEVEILTLDLEYSEKNEAEFIIKCTNLFENNVKNKFLEIVKKMNGIENNSKKENGASYFG
ncbi:MAG: hypothetical protein WC867_01245 [Candidatus Pacearchaeota archaeon]|jgi:hypothetical protein